MNHSLQTNHLIQAVGSPVRNDNGDFLGTIADITRDASGNKLEYIILKSDTFFGRGERFFAIPASSSLIRIRETGKIVVLLKEDDLQFARGIAVERCPKPNLRHGKSIYELYGYPSHQNNRPKKGNITQLNT